MRIGAFIFTFLLNTLPFLHSNESFAETKSKAEAGNPDAQDEMGGHFRLGSQQWLGDKYRAGEGVRKDEKEAIKWYLKAANQGNRSAQYSLGILYFEGTGCIKNYSEAAKWLEKSADQGHIAAQYFLGICYQEGKGVAKNDKEAVKWYQKAAYSRSGDAQRKLGECYESGRGVPKSYVEAYALFNLGDCKPTLEAKSRVARKMNSDQIEAAKKRSAEISEEIIKTPLPRPPSLPQAE
jgi:TPR repeat protein